MKDLIKKILKEETEEVLEIPGLHYFPDGIDGLKNFIQKKNITRWSLDDDLNLSWYEGDLSFLDGLVSIKGNLDFYGSPIKSLRNLKHVGGYLWLNKFLSEKYTDKEIRSMINVDGEIFRPW